MPGGSRSPRSAEAVAGVADPAVRAHVFPGLGELAGLTRALDWSQTPPGPVDGWPHSLRTAVDILLTSGYPMYIAWGPEYTQFYNDAFRPILGAKHPAALGGSSRETWAEIWDFVFPLFDSVVRDGETITRSDQQLFIDRNGYLEEAYFDFSYSPIRDDEGCRGGVFVTCSETTGRVQGERRLGTLREVAAATAGATSTQEACQMATNALSRNPVDVPFALIYLLDGDGQHARLAASAGLHAGSPVAPTSIAVGGAVSDAPGETGVWPLGGIVDSGWREEVDAVGAGFGLLPGGAWPEPATRALLLPIGPPGRDAGSSSDDAGPGLKPERGVLVVGRSPRLPATEAYDTFCALLADQLSTAISHARAYEGERKRAEALAELDRVKTAYFSRVTREARLETEIGAALTGPAPLLTQLGACAQALVDHLDAAFAWVWTLNEEAQLLELQASAGLYADRNGLRARVPVGALEIGRIAQWRRPYITNDVARDPEIDAPGWARQEGIVAFAGYPLLVGARLVGVMGLFARHPLSAGTLSTLSSVADHIALGIDRAHVDAVRIQLLLREQEARAELETINRLSQVLSAELDLDKLVQAVTDAATRVTGARFGAFFYNVLDPRGESDTPYAISGVPREAFERFPMPRNSDLFSAAFRGEGVVRIADVQRDPRYGKSSPYYGMPAADLPVASYLAVPVISRSGEVIGGLFFGHPQPGVFTERAERVVSALAAHAAIAIDNARLYEQAQHAVRVRDEFYSVAAHELKTPLTSLHATVQLLERYLQREGTIDPAMLRQRLQTLVTQSGKLGRLIAQLLDVSRIEMGQLTLEPQVVDVSELVRGLASTMQHQTDKHTIEVRAEAAVSARLDPLRFEQVITNLLDNAIKYSPDGGPITVEVSQSTPTAVEIAVTDYGIGVPEPHRDAIFDRFARVAAGYRISGMGLGLYVSRQIIRQHGGELRAEFPAKGGTRFVVHLPVGLDETPQPRP